MLHLTWTVLFAALISAAEALLGKRSAKERFGRGGYLFACSIGAVFAGAWLMFLIHR